MSKICVAKLRQLQAKQFIDANVWDGESRADSNDWVKYGPEDLQELIDELIEHLYELEPTNQ